MAHKNKPNSKAYDCFTPYAQRKIILIHGEDTEFLGKSEDTLPYTKQ